MKAFMSPCFTGSSSVSIMRMNHSSDLPHVPWSCAVFTFAGWRSASSCATVEPRLRPETWAEAMPSLSRSCAASSAIAAIEQVRGSCGTVEPPTPRES